MSRTTKADLEAQVEGLTEKLETAHSIISEALGYDDLEEEDSEETGQDQED